MSKPLITFFVCAYNQERFVREAVQGAFAQTYSPLEIILSDDCSPDRTFEIMQEMAAAYRGPHRIVLNRNQKNLGIGGHANRIFELSHGELIVGAAGDDISFKDRTERIYQVWVDSGQTAFSIYSNMIEIDSSGAQIGLWANGPPDTAMSVAAAMKRTTIGLYGCSHAFHRKIFEVFGPLDGCVVHEDDTIPFRSLLLGAIRYIADPLVYYRRHEGNTCDKSYTPPPLEKRRRILRSDQAQLVNWLHDLRKSSVLGLLSEKESERLQLEVIERLREKTLEREFYGTPLPKGLLLFCNSYFGWRTLKQILRLAKGRWQSGSGTDRKKSDVFPV